MTPAESEAAARALRWLGHSPAMIYAATGVIPPPGIAGADRALWRAWAAAYPEGRRAIRHIIARQFAARHQNHVSRETFR
jgi:hypothetical protein